MNSAVMIAAAFSIIYCAAAVIVALGARRYHIRRTLEDYPSVTVVVCARDEEPGLGRCLDSIARLDYPPGKISIILVDDESQDRTYDIMKAFALGRSDVVVLSTEAFESQFSGKQRPLDLAMRHAAAEYVFLTDADCAVDSTWIRRHLEAYNDDVGIVAGITGIETASGGIASRLQHCDQISKLAAAKGCTAFGMPLTVMGNNLSFRKSAWDAIGGFASIGPSIVEDVDFMYAVVRKTKYKLAWAAGKGCLVMSSALDGFAGLIHQRRRMLRITQGVPLSAVALIIFEAAVTALIFMAAAIIFIDPRLFAILAVSWFLAQAALVSGGCGFSLRHVAVLPLMFFYQAAYGVVLGLSMGFSRACVVWKGRRY